MTFFFLLFSLKQNDKQDRLPKRRIDETNHHHHHYDVVAKKGSRDWLPPAPILKVLLEYSILRTLQIPNKRHISSFITLGSLWCWCLVPACPETEKWLNPPTSLVQYRQYQWEDAVCVGPRGRPTTTAAALAACQSRNTETFAVTIRLRRVSQHFTWFLLIEMQLFFILCPCDLSQSGQRVDWREKNHFKIEIKPSHKVCPTFWHICLLP